MGSVKFFKSLVKYRVEWPCKNSFIRARLRFPLANTSKYVYSVLSCQTCLSSRCKPSLPAEAHARYDLYKHRLEVTVSKWSHVLNGQLCEGGGDGGEEVLPKGWVSRQEGFQSVGIRVTNTKKTKCKLSKRSKWSCPCILFPLTDPVQVIWFTNKFASCSMCVFWVWFNFSFFSSSTLNVKIIYCC